MGEKREENERMQIEQHIYNSNVASNMTIPKMGTVATTCTHCKNESSNKTKVTHNF